MRNGNKQKSVAGRLGQARRQSGLASSKTQAAGGQGRPRGRPLEKHGASLAVGTSSVGPLPQISPALADSAPMELILKEISEFAAAGEAWDKIQPLVERTIDQARSEDLDTQLTIVRNALRRLFLFEPRSEQVEAVKRLMVDRKDLMLIAKTSFGKSMMLQAVSIIIPSRITIVIIPLTAIGEQQRDKIASFPGAKPVLLTAKTRTKKILAEIQAGVYTHIIMGPEQAVGPKTGRIMRDPAFKSRVGLVAVDECHLVDHWGDNFRQMYTKIKLLRQWLGGRVPWYACSATLALGCLEKVKERLGFNNSTLQLIRTSIDRPEIDLIVETMPRGTKGSFDSLFFTVSEGVDNQGHPTPEKIPKTIIFIDSTQQCQVAARQLRFWLRQSCLLYTVKELLEIVQFYHSRVADEDKKRISKAFYGDQSPIRIVIATEALGLGVDLPDIKRIVQYGIPRLLDMAVLWQRFGRAARGRGQRGEAVWIIELWVLGDRKSKREQAEELSSEAPIDEALPIEAIAPAEDLVCDPTMAKKKGKRTACERRGDLPLEMWTTLNSDVCIRKAFLEHFQDKIASRDERLAAGGGTNLPCCNRCTKDIKRVIPAPRDKIAKIKPRSKDSIEGISLVLLADWCTTRAEELYPAAMWRPNPDVYMDPVLRLRVANGIVSIKDLSTLDIIAAEWEHLETERIGLLTAIQDILHQADVEHAAKMRVKHTADVEKDVAEAMQGSSQALADFHLTTLNAQEALRRAREPVPPPSRQPVQQKEPARTPTAVVLPVSPKRQAKASKKRATSESAAPGTKKRLLLGDITNTAHSQNCHPPVSSTDKQRSTRSGRTIQKPTRYRE
jgi:superfamily II DNA helicase RecQ